MDVGGDIGDRVPCQRGARASARDAQVGGHGGAGHSGHSKIACTTHCGQHQPEPGRRHGRLHGAPSGVCHGVEKLLQRPAGIDVNVVRGTGATLDGEVGRSRGVGPAGQEEGDLGRQFHAGERDRLLVGGADAAAVVELDQFGDRTHPAEQRGVDDVVAGAARQLGALDRADPVHFARADGQRRVGEHQVGVTLLDHRVHAQAAVERVATSAA